MIRGRDGGADDALVCADVLGAFGVSPADVRRSADGEEPLEAVLGDALGDARDRAEFCRRTICDADRGIDCSARYEPAELRAEMRSLLEGLGWSATVERRGDDGFDVAVTDDVGRRREVGVTYPDTPLGTDNLPAVLVALEDRLLAGVDARFALLSDGTDSWRAALIETDELERIRERYGDRVSAFDRPLLSRFEPGDYVPDRSSDGRDDGLEPWPEWATEGTARAGGDTRGSSASRTSDAGGSGSEPDVSSPAGPAAVDGLIQDAETDDRDERADASGTQRTLGEMWATDDGEADAESDPDSVTADSSARESTASDSLSLESGNDPFGGPKRTDSHGQKQTGAGRAVAESTGSASAESDERASGSPPNRDSTTASARDDSSAHPGTESGETAGGTGDPDPNEPADGGLTLAGGSPSVSRVRDDGVDEDSAATRGASNARTSDRSGTVAGDDRGADSSGTDRSDDAGDGSSDDDSREGANGDDARNDPAAAVSTRDARETETSGFGTLSGSVETARVTNDSFGADVETQTEDERYRALGAALGSGENVSVKGLLDDDEFLPELPAVEPETTRIAFEDEFDPGAVTEAKATAEESGFVWVDSGSMETTRVSN